MMTNKPSHKIKKINEREAKIAHNQNRFSIVRFWNKFKEQTHNKL
jgi:hypothetical protein